VHTADGALEDGYNLALLEGMATGMPVVSTRAPGSPVVDGDNGFLSDDAGALHDGARSLLGDLGLARRMRARAREAVLDQFGVGAFVSGWHSAIERATEAYEGVRRHGEHAAQRRVGLR
jgi:glycosyltransferase involved in cell wall biosynthesis